MPQAFYILFGVVFTAFTCYTLGALLFQKLRLTFHREEERPLSLLCGAAMLHGIVFVIMTAQVARKGVFLAVGCVILCYGWRRGVFRTPLSAPLPPLSRFWRVSLAVVFAAYGFLYWINAMAPEMSPDGSSYHLGLVARYLREHGFPRITTTMYANLTQGIEMLYAFAFVFGRHSAASLVHCVFTLTLPLLILSHARRFGMAQVGAAAAIFVLCAPVVGVVGTTAYIDVAVASVVFAVYSLLRIYEQTRQRELIVPIGLLAGFCFAVKYTVAMAIPFAAIWILLLLRKEKAALLRPLALFAACVALMAAPWAIKNWMIVGNPVSPFLNRYFPNPNVLISFEEEYIASMRQYGNVKDWRQIPLDITVRGAHLSGMLGVLFVLTPLALLSLRFPEGRRLLLTALLFSLPYVNNIGTRFLLPALPFYALALALACARTPRLLPALALGHALLSWPHVLRHVCAPGAWKLEHIAVAAALRITDEDRYLSARFDGYTVARVIEAAVPKGEIIFTFGGVPDAYTTREVRVGYMSGWGRNVSEAIWTAAFAGNAPVRRLEFRFPRQPLRAFRLRTSEAGPKDLQFSVNEFRILNEQKEIPRREDWRVHAWPNPWDAPMAFDNNPVTRWRTWEAIRQGMMIEVVFPAAVPADGVLLETANDQGFLKVELYGLAESGNWLRLGSGREYSVVEMHGLRRAAMDYLRQQGVSYILAAPDDPCYAEYHINQPWWGLQLARNIGGYRLYRIEDRKE
ncbi:MAG: glycosyltransferase family 39 protein [Candidatus Solibacter usitatus]|nr:glycosyltransferase family 39 protein [Candidatus Solibacter usitatus]